VHTIYGGNHGIDAAINRPTGLAKDSNRSPWPPIAKVSSVSPTKHRVAGTRSSATPSR